MPERQPKCRTAKITCTFSELHTLPHKLAGKRCIGVHNSGSLQPSLYQCAMVCYHFITRQVTFVGISLTLRGVIFGQLSELYETHACREYLENWHQLRKYCGYRQNHIPQLVDVDAYLRRETRYGTSYDVTDIRL